MLSVAIAPGGNQWELTQQLSFKLHSELKNLKNNLHFEF
jgi:hypothetical protein